MNIDQLFNKIICWGSLGSSEPRLAEHVLRYFTFEKLGIKHTCHWKYVQMDEDEVEEIKQEERYNIATLGELLVEFNYKYKDSGLTLDKFLGGYWIDRMEEVLSGSSEIDPDEIRQVQEIGVVIVSEESGGEDEDGF
ncbi:hypothetical protein BDV59DRAFT_202999 [Aspergillus ambiguus]|uniref:uncharacterized protein n=1 Tax=Aspergillus ambiguus TaxID=176160 RepID=UPI003CCCD009